MEKVSIVGTDPLFELDLSRQIAFLHCIDAFNNDAVCEIERFLQDANLFALARKYNANLAKRNVDLGFNLFAIVSDIFETLIFNSSLSCLRR
jgi:hypothetical protein